MQNQIQESDPEHYFLSSVRSPHSRNSYRRYLHNYLKIVGYSSLNDLLSKSHKEIQGDLIYFIMSSKEKGMKRAAITNYIKPVKSFCSLYDIHINATKIEKFMPPESRNRKTKAYENEQIQKLLDIADERMRACILIFSSTGIRLGGLVGLTVGNLEKVETPKGELCKFTIYENEPEQYVTFCTSECKQKGIDPYLAMRERYGEVITSSSPLIREQFDRRDQFASAHPRHVQVITIAKKIAELGEAAGLRTRLERNTGISTMKEVPNCNGFRRFFSTTLANSGVNTEHRWRLEGHNLKSNDPSYVHPTSEKLLAEYMKAHDNLVISQENRLKRQVEQLTVKVDDVDQLRSRLEDIEGLLRKIS